MTGSEPIRDPAQTAEQRGATTDEEDKELCPNGEEWCEGGKTNQLPCFACFCDVRREEG
jgi:hypothetical protein